MALWYFGLTLLNDCLKDHKREKDKSDTKKFKNQEENVIKRNIGFQKDPVVVYILSM